MKKFVLTYDPEDVFVPGFWFSVSDMRREAENYPDGTRWKCGEIEYEVYDGKLYHIGTKSLIDWGSYESQS